MSLGAANYFGLFNMFGEMSLTAGYSDTDAQTQGRLMAQARMRAQVSRSNRSRGGSTAAWMRPGYSVSLSGKSYLLLSVSSICNNCDTTEEKSYVSRANDLGFTFNPDPDWAGYSNTFTCHPLEVGPHAPEISTPRPVINGLTHAEVYAPNSTGGYALLDSQGRYNVKFPFAEAVYDSTNTAVIGEDGNPGAVPVPLRMAQINAGTKDAVHSGVNFPLTDGTEVLVVFTDGDPDRPVIVSALPNATNTGVVTADNNKTNVIKTPGGHTLTMDDTAAAPQIAITSRNGHSIVINDHDKTIKITHNESKGSITLATDKISIVCGDQKATYYKDRFDSFYSKSMSTYIGRKESYEISGVNNITLGGANTVFGGAKLTTNLGANTTLNLPGSTTLNLAQVTITAKRYKIEGSSTDIQGNKALFAVLTTIL
jgi:uncharacterized protein involved in type VI secretion and phage assembly